MSRTTKTAKPRNTTKAAKQEQTPQYFWHVDKSVGLNVRAAYIEGLTGGLLEIKVPLLLEDDGTGAVKHESVPLDVHIPPGYLAPCRTDSDIGQHVKGELRRLAAELNRAADKIESRNG